MKKIILNHNAKFGVIALGEAMLRFDPQDYPVEYAPSFIPTEGGAEYNVARNMTGCYNIPTALISANVNNPVGSLLSNLIRRGGVDQSYVKYFEYDGIGKDGRVPLNFLFKGFGEYPGSGTSDRAHSAMSKLKIEDIDWERALIVDGAKVLHTGGVCAGISDSVVEIMQHAINIAKTNKTLISYDLNLRPSQWQDRGGKETAQKINREIVKDVDIIFGDFYSSLGITVNGFDGDFTQLNLDLQKELMLETQRQFPNLKIIAGTMRKIKDSSVNDYMGIILSDGEFYLSHNYKEAFIKDRTGAGDAFATGILYGVLQEKSMSEIVNFGVTQAVLTMATPGDWSMVSLAAIERKIAGSNNMLR